MKNLVLVTTAIFSILVTLSAYGANLGYSCSNQRGEGSLKSNTSGLYDLTVVNKELSKKRTVVNLSCSFSKNDPYVFSCMRHDLGMWVLAGYQWGQHYFFEGREII